MGYRLLDHTADLGVEVRAATPEALYAEAGLALFDQLTDPARVRTREARQIDVSGADPTDLLVNFLRELLALWNGERFLMKSCLVTKIAPGRLQARLRGETRDATRHPVRQEIKAVTYHQAAVERSTDGFVARVVFDV